MNSNSISENYNYSKLNTDNYNVFNNNSNEKEIKYIPEINNKILSEQISMNNKSNQIKNLNENEKEEKVEKTKSPFSSSLDNIIKQSNKINNIDNINIKDNSFKENELINNNKNSYNILVAVRCRPLNKKEKEISKKETIAIIDEKLLKLKNPNGFLNPNNIRSNEKLFEFDYVFDSFSNQVKIFNSTTKFLIDNVINGFNATVFAYGATGAGKTYTMLGSENKPGIMPLALKELFNKILFFKNREYIIKLWYIEIYNENIRDLLVNNKKNNEYLELREDPNKGIIINNVTEITTNSSKDIIKILKKGNKNRTTEETDSNETSSRSHAILQIMVSYKEIIDNKINNDKIKYGKLNLIDLAGSERASSTTNKGLRLFEGANINKSLLTLGNCINALYDKNEKKKEIICSL